MHSVRTALKLIPTLCLFLPWSAAAQTANQQPQVRVNYLNVCTPNEAEQKQIAAALERVPQARFSDEFEISRGRSRLQDSPPANWVRIRKEFPAAATFQNAQYAVTLDDKEIIETLVLRPRDTKELVQLSFSDTLQGSPNLSAVLSASTPPDRIRLELFGKPSIVLTRCPNTNQAVYEPLFRKASEVASRYKSALGVAQVIPGELAGLNNAAVKPKSKKP